MSVNTKEFDQLIKTIRSTVRSDRVDRAALTIIHGQTTVRIFEQGRNTKDQIVGTYSESYKKTRRRKNYPISNKVIFQATGQMLSDWNLIVQNNEYGSGFNQGINSDKADWLEDMYNTKIFTDLTPNEEKSIPRAYEQALKQVL